MRILKVISTVFTLAAMLILSTTISAQVEKPTKDTFLSSIEGKVIDEIGTQALEGVKVYLVEAELNDSTDAYGIFKFDELTLDSYTIKVDHEGYEPYEETITLKEGVNVLFVKLKPKEERESI